MNFLAIIPARYASTRFPGKPLARLGGKAVIGVARRARELRVPCAALAGAVDVSVLPRAYELGLTAAFPVNPLPLPFEQVRVSCRENLSAAVENLIRFYCSVAR